MRNQIPNRKRSEFPKKLNAPKLPDKHAGHYCFIPVNYCNREGLNHIFRRKRIIQPESKQASGNKRQQQAGNARRRRKKADILPNTCGKRTEPKPLSPQTCFVRFLPTAIFNNPVFQFHYPVADTCNILRTVRNEQHRAAAVFQSGDCIQYYFC